MKKYNVAVVGATGLVGEYMLKVLEERKFPVNKLLPLASERSAGKKIKFCGSEIPVEILKEDSFKGIDFALFSAGGEISRKFAPVAAATGSIVIDNSSVFRMDETVPLVVPEVNPHALKNFCKGIIANPNCSTIQLVAVLKPIHDAAKIKRVVVSTYQSVSGAGRKALEELKSEISGKKVAQKVFPYQIAFNCIPQIDILVENGYTKEEMKVVNETKKIMEDKSISITCTAVRVPVMVGHSESVNIETEKKLSAVSAREILSKANGVVVVDDPANKKYPMPIIVNGHDESFVGRIREDESIKNGINLWIVADNMRMGAATNAVKIAELLI